MGSCVCAPELGRVWEHTSVSQLGEDVCVNMSEYICARRVGMWSGLSCSG